MSKITRNLCLSDIHFPFENKEALAAALRFGKKYDPHHIVLMGDAIDFFQISRFTKDPRKLAIKDEVESVKQFLKSLRRSFPNAKITYMEGNHEQRLEHYLCDKAPALVGMPGTTLEEWLELKTLKITYSKKPIMLGKLLVLHGHELPGRGGVNLPDTLWRNLHTHSLTGHFHRQQQKTFKDYFGNRFWCGSVGYLGEEMDYCPVNQWSHGFATVDVTQDGRFKVSLHDIVDGEVY